MEHRATTRRTAALVGLLLLLGLGGTGEAYAQSLGAEARERLSPRLAAVATGALPGERLGTLLSPVGAARPDAAPPRYGVFVHARDAAALRAAAPTVRVVAEDLFTARLTPAGLRRMARTEAVRYVEAARRYAPLNDLVRAATGAHPLHEGTLGASYTGEGVLACVIDTGIDWSHPDFRGPEGSTSRIRALWDQTLTPRSSERAPSGFGYGVAYSRGDIEQALRGASAGAVRSMDTHGHGTHVAATLAGSGAASPAHQGMAPEAELVAVKTDRSGTGIADGLRYCRSVASRADRPVVALLSLGARGGPHDGSSPLARAVDAFTGPGRSVVVAAGNDGDTNRHWSSSLPAGGADSLRIRVPRSPRQEGPRPDVAAHLDAWIEGPGTPTALLTPGGEHLPLVADTAAAVQTTDGTVVYERASPPSGERRLEVLVHDGAAGPPAPGTWSVVFENTASRPAAVHAWMTETTGGRLLDGDARSTLTVPATARSALTVGAWTHRGRWQTPDGTNATIDSGRVGTDAPFSSRGPVRGGGRKPDLVAPGQWTVSARSRAAAPPARRQLPAETYALRRGTSTAAAATAGAVALLLEARPSLPPARMSALLTETARPRGPSERPWTPRRGHGRLDVFGAMARLRGTPVAARSGRGDAPPTAGGERSSHTLGGRGAQALSTRISPDRGGAVDGLLLQTASGSANRLRDSLVVSIWTDDEGVPGRRVGAPVSIGPAGLANHTTNFVSLTGTEALVRADSAYHVVLRARDGAGELDVAGRTGGEGRSWRQADGTWSPLSSTLGVRVTTSFAPDLGAPRLSAPAASAILEASRAPALSWTAVPSAETYTVQVSSSPTFAPARTDTFRTPATALQPTTLTPSTGYHWRVRAERLGYAGPWSEPRSFLYYPTTMDVRASRAFGASDGSPRYHLVALPGRRPRALSRTVKGRAGASWSAYRETGRAEEALVPFDGTSPFRLRPGTGFWLRSDEPWRVERSVPTVPLREDGTYALELHDGWNIISNPFDLDVSWAAVDAANDGRLSPLWRFDGQFEQARTFASARSGAAFYVLNDEGRDVLRVPYPAFPDAPTGSAPAAAPPALTLRVARAGTTRSQVRVGVHEDAADGRDRFDRVAPPPRFGDTTLRLAAPTDDAPPRQQQWAAEYRSSTTDGHTFSLTLRAPPGAPVTLRAAGLEVFDGQEVVLVDPAAGTTHDLRDTPSVTIRPDEGPRSLRLLVGSSDYVETKQRVALPSDLQFLPNYPNPFSDQTTLEYVLPDPATVRLAVYDVLGRQVRVLVDERQEAGRHTVQWNGHDESGRRMASGMYLARLIVGETTKVRKMTFVR